MHAATITTEHATGPPLMSLADLHAKVQRRVGYAAFGHAGQHYGPIAARFGQVANQPGSVAWKALHADLTELLTTDEANLKRMAFQGASNARCMAPSALAMLAHQHAVDTNNRATEFMRPRVTPADLVQQFASRGITITAGADNNLLITPAGRLSDSERDLLRSHKAAILEAMASAGETI